MDKARIITEVENTEFIPGIYNYCNRWCERCSFTSRCISYAMEKDEENETEARKMDNKKFWEKLSATFKLTKEILYQAAIEQGMDLNDLDTSSGDEIHERSHEYAENHKITTLAKKYSSRVTQWFSEVDHLFSLEYIEEDNRLIIEPVNNISESIKDEIEDSVSVIRWYQFQIAVKLMRALNGIIMEIEDELWQGDRDSDGSAKVALLGIDHSIAAWGSLLKNYPSEENSILDVLVNLEKLRKEIEKQFPYARTFKRPGFDF